jgi:hypothetical protein
MRVRIFLRQPLFTVPGHVPRGAVILDGVVEGDHGLGWKVAVEGWFGENGSPLEGEVRTLIIPAAKIDHATILGQD